MRRSRVAIGTDAARFSRRRHGCDAKTSSTPWRVSSLFCGVVWCCRSGKRCPLLALNLSVRTWATRTRTPCTLLFLATEISSCVILLLLQISFDHGLMFGRRWYVSSVQSRKIEETRQQNVCTEQPGPLSILRPHIAKPNPRFVFFFLCSVLRDMANVPL